MPQPPSSPRGVTAYILIAIALIALALLSWKLRDVLVIAFGGIVLAAVLRAAAVPLGRVTGLSDRWNLAVVVVGLMIIAGLLSWLFGNQTAKQIAELSERLPSAAVQVQEWLEATPVGRVIVNSLQQTAENADMLTQAGVLAAGLVGGIGHLLLVIVVGIYLAANPKLYREGSLRLLPPERRPQVRSAMTDAGDSLRKWIIAQLLAMLGVGLLTAGGLALVGVPLALSLGLLAGLLEFVPVVGPIVAAIPGLLVAFSEGPTTALYALGVYVVVQQVESNIITPLVQRWAVKLPPVIALLSVVAFGLLFGIPGIIFATPIAVVVTALVRHLYVEDTLENGHPRGKSSGAGRKAAPP